MTSEPADQLDREDRLAAALASCLEALDSGPPVDRAALLARYPEFATELDRFLQDQEHVECCAAPLRAVARLAPAMGPAEYVCLHKELGDFRIVREVGRGGMGVVYEAEQISLRRRVALKVLPFAATMDPRHLQRFHNEAQAAACLHHTNIVPVFSVGCERSVHFYAMQFIDGQPLSEIIRQLRQMDKNAPAARKEQTATSQPSPADAASTPPAVAMTPLSSEGRRSRDYFRKVAELGVQAAEALDHAHQLGIVHRDIKPANLLLDGRGNLWVTDFGLAHVQHCEANLTLTGQAVGTPRYMSPEQASSKRAPLDHRTDVYSLGVTLYELLTLRPAFASDDRQELLRQIAFEEPPRPRRLEHSAPAELEIIVLKAMEKRPQDRYATAQELADDLRRWLLDQPIRARRPSWVQVARKWTRRHQAAVWATALVLFVLMIVGVGHAFWWMQQQAEAEKKRTAAETEARAAFDEAVRWQEEERWSEALSAIHRAQAVLRGSGSNASLLQQIEERGKDLEMAQRLEETRLQFAEIKDDHFAYEARVRSYATAFSWYGLVVERGEIGAAAELIRSHSIQKQLVVALDDWASSQRWAKGQGWKHVLAVARAADPDEWRNRFRDAWEQRDGKAMLDLLDSAKVEDLSPTILSMLGFSNVEPGSVSHERAAVVLRRVQQGYPADFWINLALGSVLELAQPPQREEAIRHLMIAVALRPKSSGARLELGTALSENGQLDKAIVELREAIRLNKDYVMAHENLGIALVQKGLLDEGIAEFREAIRINQNYARTHYSLGLALSQKGLLTESIAEYREAIRINMDYLDAHHNLGIVLRQLGHLDEAIAECREAIRINKDFAKAHCNLGQLLQLKGYFRQAVEEIRRGHELGSRNPAWPYPSAEWLRTAENFANLDGRLPALLTGKEQPKDAYERLALAQLCVMHKKLFAVSARCYSEAFAEEPRLADDKGADHRYNAACAATLAGCGRGADADKLDTKERARLRRQALDWLQADLKSYRQLLEKSAGKAGPAIAQRMQHWLKDEDFAGVRGDSVLAKLPQEERSAWRKLWADVAEILAKAQRKKPAEKKPDAKSPPQ